MAIDNLGGDDTATQNEKERSRCIGIFIAVLAVLLAICNVGGSNAGKDAAKANLDASNMWAFFQAKNLRRTQYELAAQKYELELLANPGMPAAAKAAFEKKIADYKAQVSRYKSDTKKMEGLDELFARAKALEKERDVALRKDPYFDYGGAFLQIAIVLASVAIVTGGNMALILSIVIGALGAICTLNGFFLAVDIFAASGTAALNSGVRLVMARFGIAA